MVTEEQIRELVHSIWEQEGRPNGKDVELYFRAKKILEDLESSHIFELAAPPPQIALEPPTPIIELGAPLRSKRRSRKKSKGSKSNYRLPLDLERILK
jgi:Protein of unknown function (DUF2934)